MTTAIDARTVQREEAMRRLKALRLHENVVRVCFREAEPFRTGSVSGKQKKAVWNPLLAE